MFTVKGHWLYLDGQRVAYRPSPNHGGEITPRLIVVHYTGDNSLEGALSWLCSPKAKVSAHLVVAKDGTVYQLLPFNIRAWHAGVSSYEGESGVNDFSIGIENVGIGDNWPAPQVEANRAVIAALFAAYELIDVVGHEDVAVPKGRKPDPGPRYPWELVTGSASTGGDARPTAGGDARPTAPRLLYLTRPRLTGPDVHEVLVRLRDLGYYGAKMDSTYGPFAQTAVYWFQADKGLGYDGKVGPETLAALRKGAQ